MKLTMQSLTAAAVRASEDYDDDHDDANDTISRTARMLQRDAASSYLADLSEAITVTDMWRSAASGLWAIRNKKGSRSPGYSGHNYGYSIDIGVSEAMKRLGMKRKRDLDAWMKARNWYCWRLDGQRLREEWHYDWNRGEHDRPEDDSGDDGLQRMLLSRHGHQFHLQQFVKEGDEVQEALKRLGLYHGAIDGRHGKLTTAAIYAFQRTWMPLVSPTGKAGAPTQRVLAFVAAEYEILPAIGPLKRAA